MKKSLNGQSVYIIYYQRTEAVTKLLSILGSMGLQVFEKAAPPARNYCVNIAYVDATTPDHLFEDSRIDLVVIEADVPDSGRSWLACAPEFCTQPFPVFELEERLLRLIPLDAGDGSQGLTESLAADTRLVGSSPRHCRSLRLIERYADVTVPVLIEGETGTGKELAARAIHYLGKRRPGPFQAVNCGALPDQLLENELFGHSKGAYTNAVNHQAGLVELADTGTLFLDEVDTLSPSAQCALLRFLENGSYRPLGSGRERQSDVRIVTATNKNLRQLVEDGSFREDLIFRLNTLVLQMPPLRERLEDLVELSDRFLCNCSAEFGLGAKRLHPWTLKQMRLWHWPGNVRELQHFIQRAYLLCEGSVITTSPAEIDQTSFDASHPALSDSDTVPEFNEAKREALNQFEQDYLHQILRNTAGNISAAARLAGKERRAMGKLVKKHGINCSSFQT